MCSKEISETMATGSRGGRPLVAIVAALDQSEFTEVEKMDLHTSVKKRDEGEFTQYILVEGDDLCAYYVVKFNGDDASIEQAYVIPEHRGKRLTEQFCWYLQTRENKRIVFGSHMSNDAIALAKSLARSGRFKLWWIKGAEKERFDPTEEPALEIEDGGHMAYEGPTGWNLIAETFYRAEALTETRGWTMAQTYNLFDHY